MCGLSRRLQSHLHMILRRVRQTVDAGFGEVFSLFCGTRTQTFFNRTKSFKSTEHQRPHVVAEEHEVPRCDENVHGALRTTLTDGAEKLIQRSENLRLKVLTLSVLQTFRNRSEQ